MQRRLSDLIADREKDREERQTVIELLKRLMPQDTPKEEEPVQNPPILVLSNLQTTHQSVETPGDSNSRRGTSKISSYASANTKRSAKLPDPEKLSDGVDPSFKHWKVAIQDKIQGNEDHFNQERDKMYYVFNRTTGMAQSYLFPRYEEDSVNPFLSWQEMISFLAD